MVELFREMGFFLGKRRDYFLEILILGYKKKLLELIRRIVNLMLYYVILKDIVRKK